MSPGQFAHHLDYRVRLTARSNAAAESFFAAIKRELLHTRAWPTRQGLHRAAFDYIEGWYNPRRLHSSIDYQTPNEKEHAWHTADRQVA